MSDRSQHVEAAYQYCPRCGTPHAQPGSVPFHCAACDFTSYFGPVAAVGGIVANEKNQLLLVRRARDPGKGQWGLPGGFVDRNETAEQAVIREVLEETNLDVLQCTYLMTSPNWYDYKGIIAPIVDLFFICRVDTNQRVTLAEDELEHHEWSHPTSEHLDNMAFESNRLAVEFWMNTVTN